MAYLDVIRARLLVAASVALEKRLGPRVLAKIVQRKAAPGVGQALHGLPAEVFIQTTLRNALQYLLDPILGFVQRPMREQ